VRGLDYPSTPNVAEGVQHLQMLGVKYYMAFSPSLQAQAAADPSLTQVASVGPYPVSYTSGPKSTVVQRTWKIYEVAGSALVTPLINQPVVMTGVQAGGGAWLKASEAWYLDPARWDVYEAASGPKSWARVAASATDPPRQPLPPVQVSGIHEGSESISFNVDQTGVPVLVKTSYFPNWQAHGAGTVYRVTPNLMVVVPTAHHVTLSYGYTPVDWVGFVLSLLGLAAVVVLWRRRPLSYPAPRHRASGPDAGRRMAETEANLAEPYQRLEHELADAYPGGLRSSDGDLDVWLGHPGGLDLARYYASGWTEVGEDDLG